MRSSKDAIFTRYTFDDGKVNRIPINKTPIAYTGESTRNQYSTTEWRHTFSPTFLNQLRFGVNRSTSLADNVRTIDIPPSMSWIPGEKFGYFTISGVVSENGGDYRLPRFDRLNNISLNDTAFVTRGRHAVRFGFEGQRIHFNQNTTSQRGGIVTFPTLANFLAGTPSTVEFVLPGKLDPVRGYRQWLFAMFAQDDVRVKSNFTLNLGLRYEFITVPTEVNGKISNLRNVNDSQTTVGDPWHNNPSLKNFAPRVGLVWDPFKTGKTSIRSGFGIFFDEILPKYYFFTGSLNPPFTTRTSLTNPPFPRKSPDSRGRYQPRAVDCSGRCESLPATIGTEESEFRRRLAASDGCAIILQFASGERDSSILEWFSGAGVLYVLAIHR